MSATRNGFNLVEILITLAIIALLTTVIVNAVSDYRDKLRIVVVKNDLMLLAQMCKYVESTDKTLIQTISDGATQLSTELTHFIIRIPHQDPWGRQYELTDEGHVIEVEQGGQAYIIDRGMGRIINPGPDGTCSTLIGRGVADKERDLVVEYRQTPWLIYNMNKRIFIARGDGGIDPIHICDGIKMNVSYDRQTFVFLDPSTNLLKWGRVDENPNLVETTCAWAGDAGTYPFFAVDGIHVIVTKLGGTHRDVFCVDTNRRTVRQLTTDEPIFHNEGYYTGSFTGLPQTIFNDGRSAFYHIIDVSLGILPGVQIAVSSDGKLCFHNVNHGGIDVVLTNGTGRRTVVRDTINLPADRDWYRPLFWLDTETIVYLDKLQQTLYRVKQDGSYRVSLYPAKQGTPAVIDTTVSGPFAAFAPSPDRLMVGFLSSPLAAQHRGYRIVRTDGSGCVMNKEDNQLDGNLPEGRGFFAPTLWAHRGVRMGEERRMQLLVPEFHPTSTNSILEVEIVQSKGKSYRTAPGPNAGNEDQGMVPLAWDLDRSGNLLAIVSRANSGSQRDGVFVYSIAGPRGATTDLTRNLTGDFRVPQDDFCSMYWIK